MHRLFPMLISVAGPLDREEEIMRIVEESATAFPHAFFHFSWFQGTGSYEDDVNFHGLILHATMNGDYESSLIEIGHAVGLKIPVAIIGPPDSFGYWQTLPMTKYFGEGEVAKAIQHIIDQY